MCFLQFVHLHSILCTTSTWISNNTWIKLPYSKTFSGRSEPEEVQTPSLGSSLAPGTNRPEFYTLARLDSSLPARYTFLPLTGTLGHPISPAWDLLFLPSDHSGLWRLSSGVIFYKIIPSNQPSKTSLLFPLINYNILSLPYGTYIALDCYTHAHMCLLLLIINSDRIWFKPNNIWTVIYSIFKSLFPRGSTHISLRYFLQCFIIILLT